MGSEMCIRDRVSVAKRDLRPGDSLDGEGGYTVWGKLVPAQTSIGLDALPIGLAHSCVITRPVKRGQVVSFQDVSALADSKAVELRKTMAASVST